MDSLSISTNASDKNFDLIGSPISFAGSALLEAKAITSPVPKKIGMRFEGHRGAGLLEPENTIRAFQRAIELGIDGIELDVFVSKDGVPFVVHGTDDGIIEFKDSSLNVHASQMDSKNLKDWRLVNDELIPTLEEVLLLAKDKVNVNIEFKEETQRVVKPTVEMVIKLGMLNQVCFSSFMHKHKMWLEEARLELGLVDPLEFGFLVWQLQDFGDLLSTVATSSDTLNIDIDLLEKHEAFILQEMIKAQEKQMKIKFYFAFEKEENDEVYKRLEDLKVDTLIINHPLKSVEYMRAKSKV